MSNCDHETESASGNSVALRSLTAALFALSCALTPSDCMTRDCPATSRVCSGSDCISRSYFTTAPRHVDSTNTSLTQPSESPRPSLLTAAAAAAVAVPSPTAAADMAAECRCVDVFVGVWLAGELCVRCREGENGGPEQPGFSDESSSRVTVVGAELRAWWQWRACSPSLLCVRTSSDLASVCLLYRSAAQRLRIDSDGRLFHRLTRVDDTADRTRRGLGQRSLGNGQRSR